MTSMIMNWLTGLNGWIGVVSGIIAGGGAIFAFSKKARAAFMSFLGRRKAKLAASKELLRQVELLHERFGIMMGWMELTDTRLATIEGEMKVNGGRSTKDYIIRLESYRKYQFWTQNRPAFECTVDGKNTLVSEAYCLLVGVANENEILNLDWRQFLYIEDEPLFLGSFRTAALSGSAFRGRARFVSKDNDDRGLWEVRAVPLGPRDKGELVYVGHLHPVDDIAEAFAKERRWIC